MRHYEIINPKLFFVIFLTFFSCKNDSAKKIEALEQKMEQQKDEAQQISVLREQHQREITGKETDNHVGLEKDVEKTLPNDSKIEIDVESSSSMCFIRDIIYQDDELYIQVDYVNIEYGQDEIGDTFDITNNNPKLRVFKIKKGLKINFLGEEINFKTFINKNNPMERNINPRDGFNSLFEVVVKNGIVTKIHTLEGVS